MKTQILVNELQRNLAEFERDQNALALTRVYGSSYYVSMKNALYFYAASPAKDEHPDNLILFRLFFLGLYKLVIVKRTRSICFSADSGIYYKPNGKIGDHFLELTNSYDAMKFVAIGSARDLPSPTCFSLNDIVADNIVTAPFSIVIKHFLKLFLWVFNKKSVADLKIALERYGIMVSCSFLIDLISRDHARYLVYLALLRWLRPKQVFLVSAAGRSFIVNAAHKVGAEVVEIQHGDCGRAHKGFNYRCKEGAIAAPDALIVRNEHWRNEAISAGFFTSENVFIGAHDSAVCPTCRSGKYPDFLGVATGQRYLVFTSQPPVISTIREQIEDAYSLLERYDLYLVYKFHPADGTSTIADLESVWSGKQRLVLISKPVCLKCLLRSAVAHVSFWSTCHHDAVEELGHTYVLNFEGVHHYDEYCQREPDVFRSASTLSDAIRRIVKDQK